MEYHADISKDLSADELALLDASKALWETRTVPARSLLLEQGKQAQYLYHIKKGCLRLYTLDEGREVTFQFFFEGSFVASFESFYRGGRSEYSLEAVEQTEVIAIRREDFFALLDQIPRLRLLYEDMLVERFCAFRNLFLSRIKHTPQQRYEELLSQHPEILRRVPQHYIASYLGITPVSLSRIRNRR